jgi:osmotically-inducible protein OsmY
VTRFLIAVLLLTGCSAQKRSSDPIARDREIERDIQWKLRQDPRLAEVIAESHDGQVVLRGPVTTPEARAEAERLGWEVRSVKSLRNDIQVKPK